MNYSRGLRTPFFTFLAKFNGYPYLKIPPVDNSIDLIPYLLKDSFYQL